MAQTGARILLGIIQCDFIPYFAAIAASGKRPSHREILVRRHVAMSIEGEEMKCDDRALVRCRAVGKAKMVRVESGF